jgi:hypothetical protein
VLLKPIDAPLRPKSLLSFSLILAAILFELPFTM